MKSKLFTWPKQHSFLIDECSLFDDALQGWGDNLWKLSGLHKKPELKTAPL